MTERSFDAGITGIDAKIVEKTLTIRSNESMKVLSSAVLNGGLSYAYSIINHQVPRNFWSPQPERLLEKEVRRLGLPEPAVGLMTAVDLAKLAVSMRRSGQLIVTALTTAGLSYPVAAGDKVPLNLSKPCTINTIILVDGNLTDECLVGMVKTATEAKALTLVELDIRSRFSKRTATETTTDAIAVACTSRGEKLRYSGTATLLGQMIARTVGESIEKAVEKEEGLTRQRPLIRRLEERGIGLRDLVKTGMKFYVTSDQSLRRRRVPALVELGLVKALEDRNVSSLILAALRLQEEGELGLIPSLQPKELLADPVSLVADEIIGAAIANYIAGTRGTRNFQSYDKVKPESMKRAGPFLGDAIGGLVTGVISFIATGEL